MALSRTRQSDREYAYATIKAAICNGEILPGERIVELAYADLLNLSRTPIREAIRMLEQEGLIEFIPKKGAMARGLPTEDMIEQVYTIRKAVQLAFAERTIARMSEEQLAAMDACNQACLAALEADDAEAFFKSYDRSNCILLESTQASLATTVLEQVNNYDPISSLSGGFSNNATSKLREKALCDRARREEAAREHLHVADAIRARDAELLRAALALHVDNAKAACFKGLDILLAPEEGGEPHASI